MVPKYLDPRSVSVVQGAVEETTALLGICCYGYNSFSY